jgi:hypothetical protein
LPQGESGVALRLPPHSKTLARSSGPSEFPPGFGPRCAAKRSTAFRIGQIVRFICFALVFTAFPFPAAAEDFTNAIRAFLQKRVEKEQQAVGIVVGLVDEHGSRIVRRMK